MSVSLADASELELRCSYVFCCIFSAIIKWYRLSQIFRSSYSVRGVVCEVLVILLVREPTQNREGIRYLSRLEADTFASGDASVCHLSTFFMGN